MKHLSLLLISLLYALSAYSQSIEGAWLGTLQIGNNSLRVGFTITQQDSVYQAKMDSPDQQAFGLPTNRTSFEQNKLEIVATQLGIYYRGTLMGDSIKGTFSQGGIPLPLTLHRQTESLQPLRTQMPQPPFPYLIEEVTIPNKKADIALNGTLTLPDTTAQVPAVLLIAGSGPNDRDETIFNHKPFWVLADYLTRQGYAVLRYDKRGVGSSSGKYERAKLSDFAADASEAVMWLRQDKRIDNKQIYLLGHSEGGIVAPMVAQTHKEIAGMVLLAAPGIRGVDIILKQNEHAMVRQQMEPENIARTQALNAELFDFLTTWENTEDNRTLLRDKIIKVWESLPLLSRLKLSQETFVRNTFNAAVLPSYRSLLAANPADYLAKLTLPTLILNGEKDTQVFAPENPEAIATQLKEQGNTRVTMKLYPQLNHLFQEAQTGEVDEYGIIEQTISPEVLEDILVWLNSITNP